MTATLARRLAAETNYASPDEAFLAGLLHDIGRLILATNFPKEYGRIIQQSEAGHDLDMLEQQALGVSHAEVGAWLVRKMEAAILFSGCDLVSPSEAGPHRGCVSRCSKSCT